MDEVTAVINELSSIINELSDIENELRSKFTGIYTEQKLASVISDKIGSLSRAKSKLQNIDRSQVNE
ncbi:MAG: hypothetical protein IKO47_03700 [Ruminococcus sp.]|nr:hypothetical protein [Ruminococcus sp.]